MIRRTILVTLGLLTSALAVPTAQAGNVESLHVPVTGAAFFKASTCAEEPPFDLDVVCTEFFVLYFQEGRVDPRTDTHLIPTRAVPWGLYVTEDRFIIHGDDDVEQLSFREGFIEDPEGSFDSAHLLRVSVTAEIAMDDGSTLPLDLVWDMSGRALEVAGIDGPIQEVGIPWGTHTTDRCSTEIWLAHQIWRSGGAIVGSIDGMDAGSLSTPTEFPFLPFVGKGQFTGIITEHGGYGCP